MDALFGAAAEPEPDQPIGEPEPIVEPVVVVDEVDAPIETLDQQLDVEEDGEGEKAPEINLLEESLEQSQLAAPSEPIPALPLPTITGDEVDEIPDDDDIVSARSAKSDEGYGGKIYLPDGTYTTTTDKVGREVEEAVAENITSPVKMSHGDGEDDEEEEVQTHTSPVKFKIGVEEEDVYSEDEEV